MGSKVYPPWYDAEMFLVVLALVCEGASGAAGGLGTHGRLIRSRGGFIHRFSAAILVVL